jgi:hypothetical protein
LNYKNDVSKYRNDNNLSSYEILTDPVKRRKFESSRPFDNTTPKESDCAALADRCSTDDDGKIIAELEI